MAKKMPKYMVDKVRRMNALMQQIVDLNMEVEEWLEKNGVENPYEVGFDYHECRGYEVYDVEGFVQTMNEAMNEIYC